MSLLIVLCLILMYYSSRFGVSSLYQIGLENEIVSYTKIVSAEVANDSSVHNLLNEHRVTINQLGEKMFNLNPYNPDVYSLLAYVALNSYWDGEDADESLKRSSHFHLKSALIRPVGYHSYAQEVFTKSYQQRPFYEIEKQFELAERFGPYEYATAQAGIFFLFSHWTMLTAEQRVKAVDYVMSYKKYGLTASQLNELISSSPEKLKLCNVAKFVGLYLRTCR